MPKGGEGVGLLTIQEWEALSPFQLVFFKLSSWQDGGLLWDLLWDGVSHSVVVGSTLLKKDQTRISKVPRWGGGANWNIFWYYNVTFSIFKTGLKQVSTLYKCYSTVTGKHTGKRNL